MAAGARLNYSRSYIDIGNLDLDLGDDLTFDIKDYKYLEHTVYASGFLRTYMGFGKQQNFRLSSMNFVCHMVTDKGKTLPE